jgi:hypothetical protein
VTGDPSPFVMPVVTENEPCDHPGPTDNPRYQRTCRACGRLLPEPQEEENP